VGVIVRSWQFAYRSRRPANHELDGWGGFARGGLGGGFQKKEKLKSRLQPALLLRRRPAHERPPQRCEKKSYFALMLCGAAGGGRWPWDLFLREQ